MFFRKLFCLILLFMKKKKETILNTNRKKLKIFNQIFIFSYKRINLINNTFFFNEIIIFLQNKHFSWKKKKNLKTSKK